MNRKKKSRRNKKKAEIRKETQEEKSSGNKKTSAKKQAGKKSDFQDVCFLSWQQAVDIGLLFFKTLPTDKHVPDSGRREDEVDQNAKTEHSSTEKEKGLELVKKIT